MTKVNKNNIKRTYLHIIEYIHPFTIDNKEAPREDKPISIHQNSSIKLQFIFIKSVKISREIRDPDQSNDDKMNSSHLYLYIMWSLN